MNMRRPALVVLCAACALTVGIRGLFTVASAADSAAGPPVVRRATDVALPVDAETLDRQYRALSSMPSVEVVYSALGPVRSLNGTTGIVLSRSTRDLKEGQGAPEVVDKFKDVLLAAGSETLKVRLNRVSAIGRTIRMDQFINGIPVLYGTVSLGIDDATGLVNGLGATFLPDRGLPRQPKISAEDAVKRVEQLLVERGIASAGSVRAETPTLAYTGNHPKSTRGHLVWAVPATYTSQTAGTRDGIFWLDAIDGTLVGQDAMAKDAALNVDTANFNTSLINSDTNLPSALTMLFVHPGSSTDQLAMNAYNNLLQTMNADEVLAAYIQLSELRMAVHVGSN
jgi:hypothetical protein